MAQNKLSSEDVLANAEELSFPKSVVEFMRGEIGQPHGGFPEPLRSKVCFFAEQLLHITDELMIFFGFKILKGMPTVEGRPGESLNSFDFEKAEADLIEKFGNRIRDVDVMSYAMYPAVASDFFEFRDKYGPVTKLDTRVFLVGPKG